MKEDKPTLEEQEAALALARALDGEGGPEVPDDALQAAALLRYSRDGGELASARRSEILDELLDLAAKRPRPAPAWRRWLVPAGALAAVGAAVAISLALPALQSEPQAPAALPAPSASLLGAQVASAQPGRTDLAGLGTEMRSYRNEMYAALIDHYEAEESAR